MRHTLRPVYLCLACCCLGACEGDRVLPGFYGEPERKAQSLEAAPATGQGGPARSGARQVDSGGAGDATTGSEASGDTNPGQGGAAGSGNPGGSADGSAIAAPGGDGDPCDISGRWLVTVHAVTEAIGQQQTSHRYTYYEIGRRDGAFAITKGLLCGFDAIAAGLFAISGDFRSGWAASTQRVHYDGRPVSSSAVDGGCQVTFGKWYAVHGATLPHYLDPSTVLPSADQPASDGTPGWEDWDGDGQPGITGVLSGAVAGKIFVVPRVWTEFSGEVDDTTRSFLLPLSWNQEQNVIGYEGSPLLASQAVRAANASLHFVELTRLEADQATGDDLAICEAIVELAPSLTPTASAI